MVITLLTKTTGPRSSSPGAYDDALYFLFRAAYEHHFWIFAVRNTVFLVARNLLLTVWCFASCKKTAEPADHFKACSAITAALVNSCAQAPTRSSQLLCFVRSFSYLNP